MDQESDKKDINNILSRLQTGTEAKTQKEQNLLSSTPPYSSLPPIPRAETPLPEKSMSNVFGDIPLAPQRKLPKKALMIFATVLVFVVAAVGIIMVKGEELGIIRPKPEKVLAEMLQNTEKIKTAHSEGNGQLVISNKSKPDQSYRIDFKLTTDEDSNDPENLKVNLNYDLNLSVEGMIFSGNFDIIAVDKIAYFRLNKAPLLPYLDFGKLKGKWVKIDPKEIEKLNSQVPGLNVNNLGLNAADSSKDINAKTKELISKYSGSVVKIQNQLPDETIDGIKAYSYQISLDKTTLIQVFNELKDIEEKLRTENNKSAPAVNSTLQEMQSKAVNEIIGLIADKADIKILVGKKDKLMHRAVFKMNINGNEFGDIMTKITGSAPSASAKKDIEGLNIDFSFDIKYSNFNKPIDIKAPENAEDFMKALGIEESLKLAKQKANDARRQSELQQLRTALILYYDDNNAYPVTAGIEKTNDKNSVLQKLAPGYISKLPIDPLDPGYYYAYKSDGKSYELSARAEAKTSICTKVNESLCLFIIKGKDGM